MTLCKLNILIPLYSFFLSATIIKQLVLHILLFCLTHEVCTVIQSKFTAHPVTPSRHKGINHCFHLKSISCSLIWKDSCVADKEILILIQHLIGHQLFDKIILSSLPLQYRSVVANNTLGLLKIVLYFIYQFQHLLRKFVALYSLFLLDIQSFFFFTLPKPPFIWWSTKLFIVLNCVSSSQRWDLKSIDGLNNTHTTS